MAELGHRGDQPSGAYVVSRGQPPMPHLLSILHPMPCRDESRGGRWLGVGHWASVAVELPGALCSRHGPLPRPLGAQPLSWNHSCATGGVWGAKWPFSEPEDRSLCRKQPQKPYKVLLSSIMPILWQNQGQILNSGHRVDELYFNKKTSGVSLEGGRRATPRCEKKKTFLLKKKRIAQASLGIGRSWTWSISVLYSILPLTAG